MSVEQPDEQPPDSRMNLLRAILSVAALLVAAVHVLWPDLRVDTITLGLFILAILPWLAPIFTSIELPGGWKFEFRQFQQEVRQQLEVKSQQVEALSSRVRTVEAFTFSGRVTSDAERQLNEALQQFHSYLESLGLQLDQPHPTVHIGPLDSHDWTLRDAYSDYNAFYDGKNNMIVLGEKLVKDPDVVLREYSHHVLGALAPNSHISWGGPTERERALVGIWSGLADYLPCSFKGDPHFGAASAQVFNEMVPGRNLPYIRNLDNNRHVDKGKKKAPFSPQDIGEIWGGAFWELRELLEQDVTDRGLLDAWKALNSSRPTSNIPTLFMDKLIEVLPSSENRDDLVRLFRIRNLVP